MYQKECFGGVVLLLTALVANCGNETESDEGIIAQGGQCTQSIECIQGTVCSLGVCQRLCRVANECWPGQGCVDGICSSCLKDIHCQDGYRCLASLGVCYTGCEKGQECRDDYYCGTDGRCQKRRETGAGCVTDMECFSGFCRQGFCCDSDCSGDCWACNVERLEGFCSARPRGSQSGRCQGQAMACDGANNTLLLASCDGYGNCVANIPGDSCFPYLCSSSEATAMCKTQCQHNNQCVDNYECQGGKCTLLAPIGEECSLDEQCASGHCVENFCCDSSCGRAGYSCAVTGSVGTCVKLE